MKSLKLTLTAPLLFALAFSAPLNAAAKKAVPATDDHPALSAIVALDANEVLAGIQALNKNTSYKVESFAKMMISDHGKNMGEALDLANKLHALPLNPNPMDLHSKGSAELVKLAALSGDQYSMAYADAMVTGHENALNIIDNKLLKMAKNEELKTFLTDTRAAVAHHLEEAKKLQAKLKS